MGDVVPVQGGIEAGLPDISVRPDFETLTPLPWEPGTAVVHRRRLPARGGASTGVPARRSCVASPGCSPTSASPRSSGLSWSTSCCEQDDASPTGGYRRYADQPGNVYVVGRKGDPRGILLQTLRHLRDARLQVTAANHEFCGGQFEINLNHSELVDAADRAFRMKSAVQEIARHEGLLATFMAKPFNDEGGTGFHLHVSLADDDEQNVFGDPDGADGLSDAARHAIAGVLAHAPALAAILNPTINSYKRFGPDTLAPWLIDWGLDNRSAMVRIPPERGSAPGWRSAWATPRPTPTWPSPPWLPRSTSGSATSWSRPRRSRATATTRSRRRCCRSACRRRSTRSRPTPNCARSWATTS